MHIVIQFCITIDPDNRDTPCPASESESVIVCQCALNTLSSRSFFNLCSRDLQASSCMTFGPGSLLLLLLSDTGILEVASVTVVDSIFLLLTSLAGFVLDLAVIMILWHLSTSPLALQHESCRASGATRILSSVSPAILVTQIQSQNSNSLHFLALLSAISDPNLCCLLLTLAAWSTIFVWRPAFSAAVPCDVAFTNLGQLSSF